MRKSRSIISDFDEDLLFGMTSQDVFPVFKNLDIEIPKWANLFLTFPRYESLKLDTSFFEDPMDFFIWYHKIVVRYSDIVIYSFEKKMDNWVPFEPPTLIGSHVDTQLR